MADFFSNNGTTAERLKSSAFQDLMSLQANANTPETNGMEIVSDPLLPDRAVIDRLGHMDPELYDLTESSHLMRLLNVLMGGAGAGGVRRQIAVARLENSFHGMHFLDLDRFYGALFGIKRTQAELMPDFGTLDEPAIFDPYTDAAGSDAWDDVHSRDASYRDRLIKFAKALPLGGTYAGLRAAAEALFSVECEIYESWIWVDEQNAAASQPPVLIYTYTSVGLVYPDWASIERNHTWKDLTGSGGGTFFLGRTGQKNRGEVVIQPKRQIRPDEHYQAIRVLERIKPAGTQVTVDPEGLAIHQSVPIRAVASDSEYWEIIYKTTPAPNLVSPTPSKPVYPQPDPKKCQPRPCFSGYQGEKWCYNGEISRVVSYQMLGISIVTSVNFETVVFKSGISKSFVASWGLMDGGQALASRSVSSGVMTSYAYVGRQTSVSIKNANISRTYKT